MMVLWVKLFFLLLAWSASYFYKKNWQKIFIAVVFFEAAYLFYLTRSQFLVWKENDLSKYLIPPYSGIDYFIFYSFTHFWQGFFISLAAALLFLWLAKFLNKRRNYMIFQPEEPYFIAIVLFLSGHPGWVLYLILALFTGFMVSCFRFLVYKESRRLSLYYLWLPAGAAAILLNQWLTYTYY